MNCETSRLLLSLQKPGTVARTSEELQDVRSLAEHLAGCADCRSLCVRNDRFDTAIGRAMFAIPVPSGLGASIQAVIAARQAARFRYRVWSGIALAASVLLLVGLSVPLVGEAAQSRRIQPAAFVASFNTAESDPFEESRDWLESQGVIFSPAQPFDLSLLTGHSLTRLQRQSVPMLRLKNPQKQVIARIYVLRSEDFNLKNLNPESLISEYGVQVALVADALQPDRLAYLVVYTGDSLEPFLRTWSAA